MLYSSCGRLLDNSKLIQVFCGKSALQAPSHTHTTNTRERFKDNGHDNGAPIRDPQRHPKTGRKDADEVAPPAR